MATRVAQARDVALNVMEWRGWTINTDESAITVLASDSGIMFLQNYASATTYTLPAVAEGKGKMFMFCNINTATSTLVTSTTALIKGTYTGGAAKTTITSAAVGESVTIVGDGAYWYTIAGFAATPWTTA